MGSYRVIGDWKIIEQGNRWWRIGDDIEERLESLPERTLLRCGDLKKAITYETCNVLVDGAVESQCLNSGIKFLW